jgi:RND family efflux transporter MFP subunit
MSAKNDSLRVVLKVGLVLVLIAAVAVLALNSFRPTATVAAVKRDKAVQAVTGSVEVRAEGEIFELKSQAGGVVEWQAALQPGALFKEKDVLLRLDTTDLRRRIEEAERNHKFAVEKRNLSLKNKTDRIVAETALENAKRFNQRGEISDEALKEAQRTFDNVVLREEIAEFEFRKAEADYKNSEQENQILLERMSIKAPFDGLVKDVFKLRGALIGSGDTVATIYSLGRNVVAQVSEDDIGKVQLGQKAKVRLISYPGQEFDAKVSKILPIADAETRRYKVFLNVELEPEKLIPYATGEVTITIAERENQPVIPRRALFNSNFVFVVKDGRVEKRGVEVGFLALNQAEIRKGLEVGELVVVEELDKFRDGQRVRVAE